MALRDDHSASAIAAALEELGVLLAAAGENPYRARAYQKAARTLAQYQGDLEQMVKRDQLTTLPGVGPGIAAVVGELLTTGKSHRLEELREQFGAGAAELVNIPGMTPARTKALYQTLHITSAEQLKAACEAKLVRTVPGFGPRTEEKILEGLTHPPVRIDRRLLSEAMLLAEQLLVHMRRCPQLSRIDVVGSVRRWQETVGGIDFLASGSPPLLEHFTRAPGVVRADPGTSSYQRIWLAEGLAANLWVVPAQEYAYHLVERTGSAEHVRAIGLASASRTASDERQVYQSLGLPFIPPELRENAGEIAAAQAGDSFADLVSRGDLRGMIHCHTTHSDGKASVVEMAEAAHDLGMEYITITDHSPSAHYAGGVTVDNLPAQWHEIAAAQRALPIHILRGTESDIRGDGTLDYPDPILDQLEIIIASIHGRLKMDADQMTSRLVRAMAIPRFKIWGHPLGRLVLHRPPVQCDLPAVFAALAASRGAIEINGDPHRLDLEPRWARMAREQGLKFVISTDAHSVGQFRSLDFGVAMARRAGIRRHEVLNTLAVAEFRRVVSPLRAQ